MVTYINDDPSRNRCPRFPACPYLQSSLGIGLRSLE